MAVTGKRGFAALSGSAVVRLRFPGQLSLGVAGLNDNYYRDYDPKVGRCLESDPIGLQGGVNTYLYANANPIGYVDRKGQLAWWVIPAGISAWEVGEFGV